MGYSFILINYICTVLCRRSILFFSRKTMILARPGEEASARV